MNHPSIPPPWAERLAAYFEGTLPANERQKVADWLAQHPEVAAEFRALQELQQRIRSAGAAEPSAYAWAEVRERVEQGLAAVQKPVGHVVNVPWNQPRWKRAPRRWSKAAWAAAAGILLYAGLYHWAPESKDRIAAEVFPIASADDVEIVSVDAAGARALLVGEPPVQAALVLMAAGDATLKSVEIVPDGQFPEVWMGPGEQESPMIVAPVVAGQLNTP